jgi:ribosomal protein S18 acetylase RimI-like enzyme
MKTYWLNHDKKREDYFKTYAAAYDRMLIPEEAMITLVCEGKEVCGFSAVIGDGDTAYILFFLVFEEYRRKGYGSFLLKEQTEKLSEAGISVLHVVVPSDEAVCAFLEAEGFDFFPGEKEYAVSFGELLYCDKYRRGIMRQPARDVIAFKECTLRQKDEIRKILAEQGINEPRGYDMELSMADFRNGKLTSVLLCERIGGGIIVRSMLISESGQPRDLLNCIRAFNERLMAQENSASMKISFPADVNGNRSLIEFLTGFNIQIGEFNRGYVALKRII